ncbi:MAG: UDP-N-acetylmuramate--alanine ligase, partial [Elusimicrobia bacterium]
MKKVHFVGVYGAGMSALAQFLAMGGGRATGSDRFLDQDKAGDIRVALEAVGVELFPQDGSGLTSETETVVVSTAIEDDNPELAKAKSLGIKIVHRADWLAAIVLEHQTIAVAGTSGKSTVSAMLHTIFESAGRGPSVITGAGLHSL